jgi:D-alanyl-lipoteichoic acid acyltransferase DltB (MBOAT superfamily)
LLFKNLWAGTIGLPLGLSYYTFQSVGYQFDIYRKKWDHKVSFSKFLLFNGFFAQISMGPIERAWRMFPQYENTRKFNSHQFLEGIFLISLGVFKKMVLADRLYPVFKNLDSISPSLSPAYFWFVLLICFFQIFLDFSGFIDMIRGIAKIFGIELIDNFYQPYFAKNPSDLWNRWHHSLVSWLRDYVFWPLALKLRSVYLPTLLIMVIIGAWHQISPSFFIWSLYWAVILMVYYKYQQLSHKSLVPKAIDRFITFIRTPLVLLAAAFSTLFFTGNVGYVRSATLQLFDIKNFFGGENSGAVPDFTLSVLGLILVVGLETLHRRNYFSKLTYVIAYLGLLLLTVLFSVSESVPFLYLSI